MANNKSAHADKYQLDRKSGLYFIIFIIIVALILIYYFSLNPDNDENAVLNENINSQNNDTQPSSAKNNNTNNIANINTNSAIGGENLNQSVSDLDIEIYGYQDLTRTVNGEITNLNLGDGNGINIMPLSYEGMVRNSIGASEEETVVVGGAPGVKLTGSSAKDGSTVSLILVHYQNKLYHFAGNDSFLGSLNNFIKFN